MVLGLPAKLAVIANGVAPGLLGDLLAAGNEWLLPQAAGEDTGRHKGYESESFATRKRPHFVHAGRRTPITRFEIRAG